MRKLRDLGSLLVQRPRDSPLRARQILPHGMALHQLFHSPRPAPISAAPLSPAASRAISHTRFKHIPSHPAMYPLLNQHQRLTSRTDQHLAPTLGSKCRWRKFRFDAVGCASPRFPRGNG